MNNEKLLQFFSDTKFAEEFAKLETPAQAQALFEKKGLDVSIEEILQLGKQLSAGKSGELSDDDLESVAGGMAFVPLYSVRPELLGAKSVKNDN